MPEEFSPEEKLLKLIRGEKKEEVRPASKTQLRAHANQKPAKEEKRNHLKFVNFGLLAVLITAVLILFVDVVSNKLKGPISVPSHNEVTLRGSAVSSEDNNSSAAQTKHSGPSSHSDTIVRQELFKSQAPETQAQYDKFPQAGSDVLKSYTLKGIIAGENPQAIIEDVKNQKTYFLNKGQTLNNIQVEDILKDSVIVSIDGQKFELVL